MKYEGVGIISADSLMNYARLFSASVNRCSASVRNRDTLASLGVSRLTPASGSGHECQVPDFIDRNGESGQDLSVTVLTASVRACCNCAIV